MGLAQVPGLTSSLAYKAWFLLFVCLFILLKWLVCKFHSLNQIQEVKMEGGRIMCIWPAEETALICSIL